LLLSPFRVLDLTDEKGYFCSKLLGDLGAEVIRLEKPGVKRDFWWWAYNCNKTLVELDIETERERVLQLAKEADFVIESFPPGYLDQLGLGYNALREANPRVIITSITSFGQTGPYKDLNVSDLELMAMAGVMYLLGDPDRPPVRLGFPQSYLVASAGAAVGTLIAHCWRGATGEGQQVDVSAQESLLDVLMHGPFFLKWQGINPKRTGRYRLGVSGAMFLHPLIWKCRQGYIAYMMQGGKLGAYSNRTIAKYIDMEGYLPDFLRELDWDNLDMARTTPEFMAKIWEPFAKFFGQHTSQELYELALKERLQLFPVNTIADTLEDEQLKARRFWQEQEIPELGKKLKFPGVFAWLSFPPASPQTGGKEEKAEKHKDLPFEGLKVADFSWVAAGPWITQWLAGYGAEVIKVESTTRPDATRVSGPYKDNQPGLNRSAQFLVHNGGKKSITLNLNHPMGRELAQKLVSWADIVAESFSPGMMQQWGLSYDELQKINPGIIMLSASMMGATGPHAPQPGLGLQLTSLAGFSHLTGWPDRDPVFIWGAYTDVLASRLGGATLLAALDYRRRTGRGCYIDLSQYEASLQFLSPLILEYQATGYLRGRMGNRSTIASPHGVFPCQGEDRWCAVSVFTDSEWESFCQALGKPEWAEDPKFATFQSRKKNEDELEKRIVGWTAQLPREEVMARLQKAGVKAGIVQDCDELYRDQQLNHRKHFIPLNHPEVGEYDYFCPGFRLGKVSLVAERVPCIGEHNEYVCRQILGLSDEEFVTYLTSGVLQ
jgi:crotonobetainyl-CoA:carnitine CoA-transferase CaiB-like acyl-CoA transferase